MAAPQESAQSIPLGSDTETSSGDARDQEVDYDVDHGTEHMSDTDNDTYTPEVSCGQQESWQTQGLDQSPALNPVQDQIQVTRSSFYILRDRSSSLQTRSDMYKFRRWCHRQ